MLITFECPNCGTNLEIDAEAGGTQLDCPACNAGVTVPRKGFGPGATLGGFKIDRLLGRGAMGEVYLARQLSMDRDVALKILPGRLTLQKDLVERFLQEVRLLAKLDHPNIVTAYEAGEDGGVYFMAMAYVNGSPLDIQLRRDGPMPEKQALHLILQIARALAYAWNEHRLIHRDIKPGNIMLDKHGEPRLLDLGLSKSLTGAAEMTLSGTVVGTPNYMSPEQAEGRKADFRSDMYSLGATLYHLLTGQVPFAGTSIVEVLRKQALESLPDPRALQPEITAACVALLEILLAKDPARRHDGWNALIGDIERVLAGRPPTRAPLPAGASVLVRAEARPLPHAEAHKRIVLTHSTAEKLQHVEPPKPQKSKRAAALGIAAGLAALLALGGGFYFASLRDRPAKPVAMEPVEIPAPAPAPGGQTAETERRQRETLAGQFAEALAFQEEHPAEHEEIRDRWKRIAKAGSGTEFGEKARAALRQLAEAEQRAEDEAIAQIERQAEALFAAGQTEQAIASIRNFAGPFAEQTREQRRELADRFSQRAEEAHQAASRQAEHAQAKLDQVVNEVAAALFRSDAAAAQTALDTAERDATLPSQAGILADLRRTVAAVADMDKRILDSFRDEAGREIAVGFKAGPQTLKIVSVGSGEVRAQQRFSTAGYAARNFTADELGLEEKYKRLNGQEAPVREILRGLLLVQARKPTAAKKHFQESGTPLGAVLAAEVDRRMAGVREAEAEKALAGLRVQASLPADAGIGEEAVQQVRRTAYPPAAVARIRKAAEHYRQAYGDTEKARQAEPLLAALERVDARPRALTRVQWDNLIKSLEQANPGFKARSSMVDAASDIGIALDLSGDPALTNLAPLAGLPLTQLNLAGSQVSDISPLKDMPLEYLNLSGCKVSDLKPLAGSPLKKLNIDQCPVESLQDISGLQLNELSLWKAPVDDLNPLRRMPLTYLNIVATYVGDLNPIADLPLQKLSLGWTQAFGWGTPPKESMPDKWWQQLQELNLFWGNIYLTQNEADGSYLEIENTDATQEAILFVRWMMLNGARAVTVSFKYRSTLVDSSPGLGSYMRINGAKANNDQAIWADESIICEAAKTWTEVKKTIPVPARVERFHVTFNLRHRIGRFDVKDIRVVVGDGSAKP